MKGGYRFYADSDIFTSTRLYQAVLLMQDANDGQQFPDWMKAEQGAYFGFADDTSPTTDGSSSHIVGTFNCSLAGSDLDEFLLRVDRLLTRGAWSRNTGSQEPPQIKTFAFGNNRIDFETGTAQCKSGTVALTDQEARLLKLFVMNRGKPLSRSKLLEIGWGYTGSTSTRTVDNFIVRLRKYFEDNPKKPVYFKSLRSVGYVFVPEPDPGEDTR